jgi:hypothetical protein
MTKIKFFLGACVLFLNFSCSENEIIDEKKAFDSKGLLIKVKTSLNSQKINSRTEDGNFISEAEAEASLDPAIVDAREYLLNNGFYAADLIEEFGSLSSPKLIILAMTYSEIEANSIPDSDGTPIFNIPSSWYENANAKVGEPGIGGCLLQALGVVEVMEWAAGKSFGTYAAKKALIKMVGSTAARFGLGYIGVAIAIVQFTDCMGWTEFL